MVVRVKCESEVRVEVDPPFIRIYQTSFEEERGPVDNLVSFNFEDWVALQEIVNAALKGREG